MKTRTLKIFKLFLLFGILLLSNLMRYNVYAAGTKNLVATEDANGNWVYNEGYRAQLECLAPLNREPYRTAGIDRTTKIFAYAKRGEYIYFGTSQVNTTLNNGKEVTVTFPNGVVAYYDTVRNGVGHINTVEKELNGPNYASKTDGYKPFTIYVDGVDYPEGIYEFDFYSYSGADDKKAFLLSSETDADFSYNGGRIHSVDVTVVEEKSNYYTEKRGRVWANYIALGMGNNFSGNVLCTDLYVLTSDGFTYRVDLNGMDPYGFIFFANNRGLIDTSNNTSLYMSVYAHDNQCSNPTYTNVVGEVIPVQFNKPNSPDTKYDKSYKVFFENPSVDLPDYIKPMAYEPGAITDIYFTGINCVDNVGKVGEGGYFHFTVKNATSYEIKLDFTDLRVAAKNSDGTYVLDGEGNKIYEKVQAVDRLNRKLYKEVASGNKVSLLDSEYNEDPDSYVPIYVDGVVYLRNSCVDGKNSVYWNGRDGKGNYLPKGVYGGDDCELRVEITAKAGEYHFIMMDVENNRNGIKIEMLSDVHSSDGEVLEVSDEERNTVYFNNCNPELMLCSGTAKYASASQYCSELYDKTRDGLDTRYDGAAKFDGLFGDESLIDMWSYVTRQSSDETEIATIQEFTLVGIDPDDPDSEVEEHIGSITGKVFFDNNNDGGSYNEEEEDYLLENYEVDLYLKILNIAEGEYEYRYIATTRTDANGIYLFENLSPSNELDDPDNSYVVKVTCPVEGARCTTFNSTINDIEVTYDENNLSLLDVTNADVGFWWGEDIDLPDEEQFGKIEGIVYYDYDRSGGRMRDYQGDYPLEDITVTLYKKVYNEYTRDYDELQIETKKTDEDGYYCFENITFNNREGEEHNYYEVRVTSPNEYAICTTDNQTITNIKVDDNEEDDTTKQYVVNPDVGFWWNSSIDDMPKEYTGSIHGRVFYDADECGVALNFSAGGYPLENIKVTLYRYIYNETTGVYDKELIETKYTDALGEYHFSELPRNDNPEDPDNYYEVYHEKPNPYAKNTTRNQTITNIRCILEDEDDDTFDIQNNDVGFFWHLNSVVLSKVWAIPESSYPKIKCDIEAFKVVHIDGEISYQEVEELKVRDLELTSTMSWTTTLNLPGRDDDDNYIIYNPTNEMVCMGQDEDENDIWAYPEDAGYDCIVSPKITDIIPSASKTEHKLINIKRCLKIEKEVDEIVPEDTTFRFLIEDNTDPNIADRYVEITVPAGSSAAQVIVQDMEAGHNYTVSEIDIPVEYEIDEAGCILYTTELGIDNLLINNFDAQGENVAFSFNFDYDSDMTFTCHFANTYRKQDVLVTKTVEGNRGDTTKDFEWTFNVASEKGFNAVKTKNNGSTEEFVLYDNSKFTLKDNEQIVIVGMLYGMEFSVTETDYSSKGYTTTVNDVISNTYRGSVYDQDIEINYINSKNGQELLGVLEDNSPIIGVVAIATTIFVGYLVVIRCSKKRSSVK